MPHIYPVTPISLDDTRYTVKANGAEVPLQFARVSKEPFNRRWPGHQRQRRQIHLEWRRHCPTCLDGRHDECEVHGDCAYWDD